LPASRLWLHAWTLTLPTAKGQQLTLQADLPLHWNEPTHITVFCR
jgi:hypothetical protein